MADERQADRAMLVFDPVRSKKRYSPASTFKIPHTLFALDAGAVRDEFQIFRWNGVNRGFAGHNQDQDLRSAMRNSTVWVYELFAKEIGDDKARRYLKQIDYGNADPSTSNGDYWIEGSLAIAAQEQIAFLRKLYRNELPFRVEHQRLVKDLMIVEAGRNWILRAKTGWEGRMGWWVGWVEWPTGSVFFALNIDTPNRMDDLFKREAIVRAILRSIEALPPNPAVTRTLRDKTAQRGLIQTLNIMREAVIAEVSTQLSEVVGVIERHLEPTLLAVHLYGSAVDGGLKPHSDIDLLVTVTVRLDETTRRALINDLLETSASPGESEILRAVEVTIVVHDDIIPWRYPAKRELQFGEWQRNDILAGIFEPATIDIDLAILLTKAREHSVALVGPAAEELFDPVPEQDLFEALNETLTLWNSPPDWAGDERNVVLTLSRIWYSAVTGKIAPKDVAADWAMERLPAQYQPVILEARQAYLGQEEDRLASRADQLEEFVHYVKGEITKVVGK